ncbi:MAG: GGDEF domain-containing protein [Lachnospiraceae bacterium]|nr:GGDEF domain-containing protein [Lachnospiraceae bacterium]
MGASKEDILSENEALNTSTNDSSESSKTNVGEIDFIEESKKYRFSAQKKHFKMHIVIGVMFVIFFCFRLTEKNASIEIENWITLGLLFFGQFFDMHYARRKYNESGFLLRAIKIFNMAAAAAFTASFKNDGIIVMCGLSCYILMVIEYLECIEITTSEVKERVAVTSGVLLAATYVIAFLFAGVKFSLVEFVILMVIIALSMYAIVSQVYNHIDQYVSYINKLNQKNTKLGELNENLDDQSRKIKDVVELLGVQKIELSKAYETISLHSAEMELNNEILNIISEQRDMVKFVKQVTETVSYGVEGVVACGLFIDGIMNSPVFPLVNACIVRDKDKSIKREFLANANEILDEAHHFDTTYKVDVGTFPALYQCLLNASVKALMRVQVQIEGNMCGVLIVGAKDDKFFTDETKNFYYNIATQIGIGINNANLYVTMENLATKDGLTGIYNRRHFNKLFNDYVTDAMDKKLPISAALFDIDKFKNVNDTYGHSFGDLVIVTVSHIADEVVREHGGILGRYGGEEFMMAFLNMTSEELLPIVTEIHERIKSTELDHNGETVKVNVSIGVTDYPNLCSNLADLLNHADWAMYYSKQHGRGRITVDSEEVLKEVVM